MDKKEVTNKEALEALDMFVELYAYDKPTDGLAGVLIETIRACLAEAERKRVGDASLKPNPDIVAIHAGTNDSKDWDDD